jgi:hypothetical protein
MRLGVHAEQQYFELNKDKFDIVVFNANLAHHFASGTATLMTSKLNGKKFIIDPITHAYGHHPRYIMTVSKDGSPVIKSSLVSLADEYGPPISIAVSHVKQVSPNDFSSTKPIEQFAKSVIDFQAKFLASAIDPSDRKYIPADVDAALKPDFLIAPYFYMKSTTINDWLEINQKLVIASEKVAGDSNLYAEIVIDRGILDNDAELTKIANAYLELAACDGYLLWISDLSEHKSSLSTLCGLRKLVSILAQPKKPVINLYGGYYSLLLAGSGLTGVCHGPGYGEDRDVIPVGGGLPVSKYYLNPVHQRLLFRDVQFMVAGEVWRNIDDFFKEVCSGQVCQEVLSDDLKNNFEKFGSENVRENKGRTYSYPTTEARFLTTQHYLEAKAGEFKDIAEKDLKVLIEQLKEAKGRYDKEMPGAQLRYLDTWVEALQ